MMKALLCFLCLLTVAVNAQWETQNPKRSQRYFTVQFFSEQVGYILLIQEGKVIKTTNGGAAWDTVLALPTPQIFSMHFVDAEHGWLTNRNQRVFMKTTNGGATWETSLKDVSWPFFLNKDIGFGFNRMSDQGLFKTTDGGDTWFKILNGALSGLISFASENLGFVQLGRDRFARTTDGGATWKVYEVPEIYDGPPCFYNPDIVQLFFINDSIGYYAVNYLGLSTCPKVMSLYRTTNGGERWDFASSANDGFLYRFTDKDHGWRCKLGEGGLIFRTLNCGGTWVESEFYPKEELFDLDDMQFVNNKVGFAVGEGVLLKTTDGGIRWHSLTGPADFLYSGDFLNENLGWAAGDNNIVKTTDGGEKWNILADTINVLFRGIAFKNQNTGFAVGKSGNNGCIYRSDDGGNSWYSFKQYSGRPGINSIDFIDDTLAYIAASPGLLKSTDGGENWNLILPNDDIRTFFFLNKQKGWIVRNGSLASTTNGGASWNPVLTGIQSPISSIYFVNDSVGWISGDNDIIKTTDGGQSWQNKLHRSSNTYLFDGFRSVYFASEDHGWVSETDELLETTDGGNNWSSYYSFYFKGEFGKLSGFNNHVWYFSNTGSILHNEAPISNSAVFTNFSASVTEGKVKLEWITASETANKGFEIEKSLAAELNTNETWNTIAFVHGKGTTPEQSVYSYIDEEPIQINSKYRIKSICENGSYTYSDETQVTSLTSVNKEAIPSEYALEQNYPNPFNPSTIIKYSLAAEGFTTLKVYDIIGNEVAVLVNEQKVPGNYSINFNAENLSSSVYYYVLKSGNYNQVRKMLLIK